MSNVPDWVQAIFDPYTAEEQTGFDIFFDGFTSGVVSVLIDRAGWPAQDAEELAATLVTSIVRQPQGFGMIVDAVRSRLAGDSSFEAKEAFIRNMAHPEERQ